MILSKGDIIRIIQKLNELTSVLIELDPAKAIEADNLFYEWLDAESKPEFFAKYLINGTYKNKDANHADKQINGDEYENVRGDRSTSSRYRSGSSRD